MLRSNDGGLALCYALRRLANNIQEPLSHSLPESYIDASIKWWNGKPAPRATALLAPWSPTPNLQQPSQTVSTLVAPPKFLPTKFHVTHHLSKRSSSNTLRSLTNSATTSRQLSDWSTSQQATCCCCKSWERFQKCCVESIGSTLGPIRLHFSTP